MSLIFCVVWCVLVFGCWFVLGLQRGKRDIDTLRETLGSRRGDI